MRGTKKLTKKSFSIFAATALAGAACQVGVAQTANADPSPYCRPYVNEPTASNPVASVKYAFKATGTGGISCNGSVYKVYLVPVFHAQTSPRMGSDGIQSGTGKTCTGSCSVSVDHWRYDLKCNTVYIYKDQMQLTGYWQKTSDPSTKVSISIESDVRNGSSYNPYPFC